ncbi:MAG: hypothetical protein Q7R33_08685 [Nitrosarchaeum sp.]|nr:hypothetical protein [Nitrosarchaeum sp.]
MKEYILSENSQEQLIMVIETDGSLSIKSIYWTGNIWKEDFRDRSITLTKAEAETMKKYLFNSID